MSYVNQYELCLDELQRPYLDMKEGLFTKTPVLNTGFSMFDFAENCLELNKKAEEHMFMIALDTKLKIIGVFELSHGTVDLTFIQPREAFIRALLCGAVSVIFVHNHPSGDTTPSQADIQACDDLVKAGELLRIPVLDFAIVARNSSLSFYEYGLITRREAQSNENGIVKEK